MKRFFNKFFGNKQAQENQSVHAKVVARISHISRNMSRGASNIFKSLGNRATWSWRSRENKDHHKSK